MSIERLNFSTDNRYNSLESSIHVARYMIAKEFVKGKRVLDIACGEGYGSFLLHQWGALKVTGVDISADAIENAQMNFSHADIEFICSNAQNIVFEEKYDVIISLETIEHVNDESQYLNVLKNALTDDGILIVSCPNDHWYYNENESNEYHLRKYTFDDFVLSSESVLGKAKHWLLGTNVFGYGNFIINPITKKLQCDKDFLEMKDIVNQENTNCLASYSEQKHLPSEKESLYYVGIWSKNSLILNSNNGINIFPVAPAHFNRLSLDWVYIIQNRVNENFLPEKSEVRLFLEGIKYTFLYDVEGKSMQKTASEVSISILEAIAQNGGLDKSVDRKNVIIYRKFPEGIKKAQIDLTREDLQNSPYFWLQNGDLVVFNTRAKSFYGFGKEPLQTLTTGVSILTTALSIYLLITKI